MAHSAGIREHQLREQSRAHIKPLLLTPEEAAEIMAIGRTKLCELLRVGAIESVRIGGARRIPSDALEAYVQRLRTESSGYLSPFQ